MAEPEEADIDNFVSFTSTSRDQAISFLKANNLDSNKAINAYFEDPTGPQTQIQHADPVPTQGAHATAPPSRPPSRVNVKEEASAQAPPTGTTDNAQGLTQSEREERELQQAVAMSLNQNLGQQETGITTKSSNLGEAKRDYYEEDAWAMTLFNESSQEIIISADPEDRKRVDNEPAFLRPSPDHQYLGGLLTILHSIPLAREALLFRNRLLSGYGYDPQWWNGQPINLPKVITTADAHDSDTEWDDILYETQRLMAFLDSTNRSFGSCDALANLRCMSSYDPEGSTGKFLEAWQGSAVRADPGNQSTTIFSSNACKRPLSVHDTPIEKEFFSLSPYVEPEDGQTLYDVLDRTMWSDRPGDELDDVWLEHVADVLTIRIESSEATPVGVKVPAVFYPDRYLASCRELAREFRSKSLQVHEEIYKTDRLINRFAVTRAAFRQGLDSRLILEKAAAAAASKTVPETASNGVDDPKPMPEGNSTDAQRLAAELRAISTNIDDKLKELESRKEKARKTLRSYSKLLTEPSASPAEAPHHKYTLRGICTELHVTYVLRPRENAQHSDSRTDDEWQWWRISFSTDDAKTRQAESGRDSHAASNNADVIGYTACKVREIEVLHAARQESKYVLLVYANDNAVRAEEDHIPPQLQKFVDADNQAFEAEFQEARSAQQSSSNNPEDSTQAATASQDSNQAKVNVFDYQVSSFDDDTGAPEMQQKGDSLLSQSHSFAPKQTGDPSSLRLDDNWQKTTE